MHTFLIQGFLIKINEFIIMLKITFFLRIMLRLIYKTTLIAQYLASQDCIVLKVTTFIAVFRGKDLGSSIV